MEFKLTLWQRISMTAALALAFSMEQADVGVLQSMYGPIGRSLGCSAVALGTLTTWRGVVQVFLVLQSPGLQNLFELFKKAVTQCLSEPSQILLEPHCSVQLYPDHKSSNYDSFIFCCWQAAATPFVGTAGNVLNRIFLSAAGTLIWGITSIGIGASRTFQQVTLCTYLANSLIGVVTRHWSHRCGVL